MERSTVLEPAEEQLLITMMGILATVWAIGVAVYQFIYQYFAEHHLEDAKRMADRREQGIPINEEDRKEMRGGLLQNAVVFFAYIVAGILSAFMIATGAVALLQGDASLLGPSRWLFASALSVQFWLFTFEIATSTKQVTCLFVRIGPRREP